MCLSLAKSGYFGGDPERVSKSSSEWIIKTYDYEMFLRDYENQTYLLNRNENR